MAEHMPEIRGVIRPEFWWCDGHLHQHRSWLTAFACDSKARVYVGTPGRGGRWVERRPSGQEPTP